MLAVFQTLQTQQQPASGCQALQALKADSGWAALQAST